VSDRWVNTPDQVPYVCFRTRTSDEKRGPFFKFDGWFVDGETMREERRYLSKEFVLEMLRAPGSPFKDPWASLEKAEKQIASLTEQLENALIEKEVVVNHDSLVVDIASAVRAVLSEREEPPQPTRKKSAA
jgi:hypothetical protein